MKKKLNNYILLFELYQQKCLLDCVKESVRIYILYAGCHLLFKLQSKYRCLKHGTDLKRDLFNLNSVILYKTSAYMLCNIIS